MTQLPNGYIVSTIHRDEKMLAMDQMISLVTNLLTGDMGRADLATPGDYETMVFPGENEEPSDFGELDFARYDTPEEALEGHEWMVKRWREIPPGLSRADETSNDEVNSE